MMDYRADDLAEDLGVAASTVGRWEKGERTPKPDALEALARKLGVTVAWLHYGAEPMRPQPPSAGDALGQIEREVAEVEERNRQREQAQRGGGDAGNAGA